MEGRFHPVKGYAALRCREKLGKAGVTAMTTGTANVAVREKIIRALMFAR